MHKGAVMNPKAINKSVWLRFTWLPIIIALDQLSKWAILQQFQLGDAKDIFPGFRLVLAHNYGVAFGMFNDNVMLSRILLLLLAVAISGLIGVWLFRAAKEERLQVVGLVCILGGAIGNIVDRLYHGYVIDFIELYYKTWYFPAFNVADSFISVGAFFLIISIFLEKKDGQ